MATIGSCGGLARADTFHWSAAIGGSWTDTGKWTPTGVPGATSPVGSPPTPNNDVAIFDVAEPTYAVSSDPRNVHEIQLNSPNVQIKTMNSGPATNNLPAGIAVGGAALFVPSSAGLLFQGPALAQPDYIAGSLSHRGYARFIVDTRIDQGLFLQNGTIHIDSGRVLSMPTLHWGMVGDTSTTATGTISGVVTITQANQPPKWIGRAQSGFASRFH